LRWLLRPDAPLRIKPSLDPALLRWLFGFAARCNPRDFRARHRGQGAAAVALARADRGTGAPRGGWDCEFEALAR
jgi:D-amino-acid dehydrogenase